MSPEGTSTRALLGTYEYMSPEQKRGEEADERSDLYAVGVMAYRLLTSRNIGPKLPSRIDESLARGWDDFVEQSLEEERDERLASASSALSLLNTVGQESKSVSPVLVEQESAKSATPTAKISTRIPNLKSPWENSLGMKFNPVPGAEVLFGAWETRVQDFCRYVEDRANNNGYNYRNGEQPYILKPDGWKQRGWDYDWQNPGFAQGNTYPVTCVSYEDAAAFCAWLTQVERAAGMIGTHQAYRLPRDWEWSVAVGLNEPRTGSLQSKDAKTENVYPWNKGHGTWPPAGRAGNYAGKEARNSDWPSGFSVISGYWDGHARTAPVGSYDENAHGLYDMGGNVWEWCEDWYDASRRLRVLRGGSWGVNESWGLLSSYRSGNFPDGRNDFSGFRVVLSGSAP